MATLYITEFTGVAFPGVEGNSFQAPLEPGTDQAPLAIGASPQQSAAFGPNTRVVRVNCDSVCSILFGTNPTAATSNRRLAANQTEYFGVNPGTGLKLSVVQNV
jgi:hypothetical protein